MRRWEIPEKSLRLPRRHWRARSQAIGKRAKVGFGPGPYRFAELRELAAHFRETTQNAELRGYESEPASPTPSL
jgi:hypothetical protein